MANNFNRLMEEEYEPRFNLPLNNGMSDFQLIEKRLQQQKDSHRFNGDVADLFLPRMIRTVIGMFGGEVRTVLASFARPRVTFLQIDFVDGTVLHPNLKGTLDIHFDHVFLFEAVLGFKKFREDRVVKSL